MIKEYKALFVKTKTHKKVAVLAKKNGATIDAYINHLLTGFPLKRK